MALSKSTEETAMYSNRAAATQTALANHITIQTAFLTADQ
jgi:hypothetical protein